MRPLLGLKLRGSGDSGPKRGALGHSATIVEGGMGNSEKWPEITTLWRKKLKAGGAQVPAQGPAARQQTAPISDSLPPTLTWSNDCFTVGYGNHCPDIHSGCLGNLSHPPFRGPVLSWANGAEWFSLSSLL